MSVKQNPYSCGANICPLKVPGVRGVGTNGPCRCLPLKMTPAERVNLRRGIRWLAERLSKMDSLLDEGHTIVNDHLSASYGEWLSRVEDTDR